MVASHGPRAEPQPARDHLGLVSSYDGLTHQGV